MRIAVLASGDGWHVRDLARAAARLDHELLPASFRHLQAAVGEDVAGATAGRIAAAGAAAPSQRSPTIALSDVDRVLVRTMPAGSLEQVIFRMDVLHALVRRGVPVLNPPRALEAAVDKYLACCQVEAAGLPVPPTVVCEGPEAALEAFRSLGSDVVVKPLFGSEGRGLARVTDVEVAGRVFRALERIGSVLYLQRFIEHGGCDLRAFVLGDRVLAAMRRTHDSDWRTNIARGARGESVELSAGQSGLALRAARAVGAPVAGVDLLPARDGRTYVLEVNAVPGWRTLARVSGIDVSTEVLRFVAAGESE